MRRESYFERLERLREHVNALFEQMLVPQGFDEEAAELPGSWSPAVDVLERREDFVLFAELPGVRRRDIRLAVEGRRLELSGCRDPSSGGNFARMERSHGAFRRTFELGERIDTSRISARFELGVLEITLPKGDGGSAQAVEIAMEDF